MNISKDTIKGTAVLGKQRNYQEVVEFLDSHWHTPTAKNLNTKDSSLSNIKQLDKAFGNVSQQLNTILVTGSNGKSLTISFSTKLLLAEGLKVGALSAPHLLSYNERLSIGEELISNKAFTDIANDVINTAADLGITPNSHEILTMMAFLFFKANNVDAALLEVKAFGALDPAAVCSPKLVAVTRVTPDDELSEADAERLLREALAPVKQGTHVISADQSKLHLQTMLAITKEKGGFWGMPIRKLATLHYPFEQLHGRCAALAERIALVFANHVINKDAVIVHDTLLTKQKGQRGRPTLEAKKQSELHPRKTLEQFWKETDSALPGRFQLLEKEKPTILLDNASNLDALKNVLLGIRLLHYKRPLKGLTLLIGCDNKDLNVNEFLKQLRYFFKKTSGSVILCPVESVPGQSNGSSWDVEQVTNLTKAMKIKARSTSSFREAFELAEKSVDERHGLVVVTGSSAIVSEYWRYKGVKKI